MIVRCPEHGPAGWEPGQVYEHCAKCREALDSADFRDWMEELKREMVADNYKGDLSPNIWLGMYLQGYDPREALEEDYSCG